MGKGLLLTLVVLGGEVIGAIIPLFWGGDIYSLVSIVSGQLGGVVGFLLAQRFLFPTE